jgi:2-dehydro-3-deoxygalactonokinase
VDSNSLQVITEEISDKGIAASFDLWKKTGDEDPAKRIVFYLGIAGEYIKSIQARHKSSLEGLPLIISGMASSSAGILELPYGQLPYRIDGIDSVVHTINASPGFPHPVLLISGLRSQEDVMRGEETQLIGCLSESNAEGWFIFPGTHSKHIFVKDNTITAFKTYMTGEFFALLAGHSLLQGSVEKSPAPETQKEMESFRQGVKDAVGSNLLHAAFRVRINGLFGVLSKKENFHYLSGLLIGTELQEMLQLPSAETWLCCGTALKVYYEKALEVLDLCESVHIFPGEWVDAAVIRGQSMIYRQSRK